MTLRLSSVISPLQRVDAPSVARYVQIHHSQHTVILDYLLSLSRSARLLRFGSVASEASISRYVESLDWPHYCAFGRMHDAKVSALVELFGDSKSGWRSPELAISISDSPDSHLVRAELLQIAILAARERGATRLTIFYQHTEHWAPSLAAEFGGTCDSDQGIAVLPLAEEQRLPPREESYPALCSAAG